MPIYMNYDNLAIKGGVTEDGHKDWVELHSFRWGFDRSIRIKTGASFDRESSAPSVHEVVVTKDSDNSSVRFVSEGLHEEGKKVVIDFCKTDKGKLEVYETFTLSNTIISSYAASSSGDRPTEELTLNFTKIEFKNIPASPVNRSGSPESVVYDLATAKVS